MMEKDSLLDKAPSTIAALSAYSVAASILYNFGFFGVYGLHNLGLLSLSDHLQSAIKAIPYVIFMGVFLIISAKFVSWCSAHLRKFQNWILDIYGQKKIIRFCILSALSLIAFGLFFFVIFMQLYNATSLPTEVQNASIKDKLDSQTFMTAILLIISSIFAACVMHFDYKIFAKFSEGQKFIIALLPLFLFIPLEFGVREAKEYRDNPLIEYISINDQLRKNSIIVRYLERGVLLYSICKLDMEFISWSEIKSIRYFPNLSGKSQNCN